MNHYSNLYQEQQHRQALAWDSAAESKLAASRNLMAVRQQNQDYHRCRGPDDGGDHHYPAEDHVFSPKRPYVEDNTHTCEGSGTAGGASGSNSTRFITDDVVFYVGQRRHAYHVNAKSLIKGSSYFRNLLQHADPTRQTFSWPPIVMDCEEGIFESLLLLIRYGTLEALPPMSAAETFKLKREAQFYGIPYTEPLPKNMTAQSGDDSSDLSSASLLSSPSGSPKSMMNMSPPAGRDASRRTSDGYYEGVRLACSTSRQLGELAKFPLDLADPARLVLVSCLDQEKASTYTCDCAATSGRIPAGRATQWALNFHHRHAFCTACGRPPNMSSKHFAEMFMAVATHYYTPASPDQVPIKPNSAWWVSSDSTCMLRFVSSTGDGPDACGCSASVAFVKKQAPSTIWAANCFFSHAFCTRCLEPAQGPVLLSLILALRYGGSTKAYKSSRSSFRIPTAPAHPG